MRLASKATLRRGLLWVAAAAGGCSALIAATGGLSLRIAGTDITARHPTNPLIAAVVAFAIAAWLARPNVDVTLANDLKCLRFVSPATWLLVAGTTLRLWYWAASRPLWLDEQMIALNVRDRGFAELTGPLWLGQSAPLGWLWSERLASLVLGLSEAGLRAMPVAFGIATLVAGWWMGRRWLSTIGAATLMFLLAFGAWIFSNAIELKHYSADTLFGLWLPALVVWATEATSTHARTRRALVWWAAAAVGGWCSMGATLVAPACAAVLVVALWRRDGTTAALRVVAGGVGWLVVFAAHYYLSLRFATSNTFLYDTWANWLAPAGAGVIERLVWVTGLAAPMALKPGGTGFAWVFWSVAICGFVAARPRRLGLIFALIPLSAAALAILRIVPLFERLSIWSLPAVYAGIALAVDAAYRWARAARTSRRVWRVSGAAIVGIAALILCIDIGHRALIEIPGGHGPDSNHNLNDRDAMKWLSSHIQPGDIVFTTALAKPAVWWYGKVPLNGADDAAANGTTIDGAPITELTYHDAPCHATLLASAVTSHARGHIFFGFRFDDVPDHFDDLVMQEFRKLGVVNMYAFAGVSRVAEIEFGVPDPRLVERNDGALASTVSGCLGVKPAARW